MCMEVFNMSSKLKLEDLKVGMKVYVRQLSDIHDTFIYLSDFKYEPEVFDTVGIVAYFGNLSIKEAGLDQKSVCSIYNPLEEEGLDDYE